MKKISNIFILSAVALMGLSLAACSEDDYNTNPYSKSGVNLLAFGPSPNTRSQQIRITGTNMQSVDKVIFAGGTIERAGKVINLTGAEVERANFNSSDNENIYVTIPEETVPGNIRLIAGNDTIISEGTLTFEEPIEVTSVSPIEGLNAGDEISIKGDYVYNIAEVIFTSGVSGAPVAAEDFTYVSRKEIRLLVPLAAESGTITVNDGADWEEDYKDPVTINTASVSGITASADFGQQIQITGSNLHTVESVIFPGGVSAEFNVSADHKTITATVPAETKSGVINLVLYSGASLTTDELSVPTLAVTNVSKEKDLKVGDTVVLTGENLDRITSITMPGHGEMTSSEYTISGNTLTFTVPEDMTDGSMVLTQNSFISVTLKFIMHTDSPEQTIWAGEFVCSGWGGNQDLAWGGFDWTTVAANSKVSFYFKKNNPGAWGCISLRHGNSWGNLPAPIPGQYDLDEDEGVLGVIFTQEVLDDIIANGGLVMTGDNYTLTKVTIPAPVTEVTIWQGSEDLSDGHQPYIGTDGGIEFSENDVKAGQTVKFYFTTPGAEWWFQVFEGHWDKVLGMYGEWKGENPEHAAQVAAEGCISLKLTQDMIDAALKQQWWGGIFVVQGNITLTKVTVAN